MLSMTTAKIAAANNLPLEIVERNYRDAVAAGLTHDRALMLTAGIARGIIEERARIAQAVA
jgi:hypothetical protein